MSRARWGLKAKLVVLFITIGSAPMLISNIVSYLGAASEIEDQARTQSAALTNGKVLQLEQYFSELKRTTLDLAYSKQTLDALRSFDSAISAVESSKKTSDSERERMVLTKFYNEVFQPEYVKQAGSNANVSNVLGELDRAAVALQSQFIAENPHPLGQKNKLIVPTQPNAYSNAHEKFHTSFNNILENHNLYDIFLINAEGRVVYSVFKEVDFGTSLETGPWRESGLSAAYRATKLLKPAEVHFVDYTRYSPSYESAAGFLSSTVLDDSGKNIGAVVVQFPIEKVNSMFHDRTGLGQSGEFLLISAKDGSLRVDANRGAAIYNVKAQFKPDSKLRISSEIIDQALKQQEPMATYTGKSYDGTPVISSAKRVNLANVEWIALSEMSTEESLEGLQRMLKLLIAGFVLCAGLVAVIATGFGNSLAKELGHIADSLSVSSQRVSEASTDSAAGSAQLSEAATQQAASLQQTMSSIEQISAMVQKNAESATRAQQAVETNLVSADEGARSAEDVQTSIQEIKTTNEEILQQMEASNRELTEIAKIISEIGQKTSVINDIVFQTKLLSFNASVEAARAGEHGKGFAVVAEEVGSLAQMSGNAAREIEAMLSKSVQRVNGIVLETRSRVDRLTAVGQEKVARGELTAERCKAVLLQISGGAQSLSEMVSEIAHASKEQALGIQEINKAIAQLDQVTQQNTQVAQKSSAQADDLSQQAIDLQTSVVELLGLVQGSRASSDAQASTPEGSRANGQLLSSPSPRVGGDLSAA